MIPRIHAFEFNDQPWLPTAIRLAETDYLATVERLAGMHERLAPIVDGVLEETQAERIVDLGSGSGGPIVQVMPLLTRKVPLLLTDITPAASADSPTPGITFHPEPVDARGHAPEGLRTMFNALHHFRPDDAQAILASAFNDRSPFVNAEVTERKIRNVFGVFFIPLLTFLTVPFIRPVRPITWLITYVIPILPALITYDGIISHLRTYTVAELEEMTSKLQAPDYRWTISQVSMGPGTNATVVTGVPIKSAA